jgi:uncharacterized membrane protein
MKAGNPSGPLIRAGMVLGIGLGGFIDGIVFHQILQVHGMLTARVAKTSIANVEINMFWDGMFHAFTWLMTVAGVVMLFRAQRRADAAWSARAFAGALALGWGMFNLVEGVINHHLLDLHHVVEARGESVYDLAFLALGAVLALGGWLAIRLRPTNLRPNGATHTSPG